MSDDISNVTLKNLNLSTLIRYSIDNDFDDEERELIINNIVDKLDVYYSINRFIIVEKQKDIQLRNNDEFMTLEEFMIDVLPTDTDFDDNIMNEVKKFIYVTWTLKNTKSIEPIVYIKAEKMDDIVRGFILRLKYMFSDASYTLVFGVINNKFDIYEIENPFDVLFGKYIKAIPVDFITCE